MEFYFNNCWYSVIYNWIYSFSYDFFSNSDWSIYTVSWYY